MPPRTRKGLATVEIIEETAGYRAGQTRAGEFGDREAVSFSRGQILYLLLALALSFFAGTLAQHYDWSFDSGEPSDEVVYR